ncbi:MAG: S1 RNA-binding domain-containing protein [Elusimicrobia bacterium]|nr:S1 RNA-binding domain-containing protein [Elusimicrobiota bacterium]
MTENQKGPEQPDATPAQDQEEDMDMEAALRAEAEEAEAGASSGEPTMEGLLAAAAQFQEKLRAREVVWVKVVQLASDNVLVDIGEKHEAVIPVAEFPADAKPAVGSRVPAVLVHGGRGDSPAVLSCKKARGQLGWSQAVKAHQEKARVRGSVTQAIKGGFIVDVSGVQAFLPASLADLRPVRKPETMVGSGVRCYIIEVHADKRQLVLSRKAVLEEEVNKRRVKLLGKLKVGDVMIARIGSATAAGVAVNLGGVDGFIGNADVAWKEPEKAKAALKHGDKLRVKVLRVDAAAGRIACGIRQLTANPADQIKKKYPAKTVVKGKIVQVTPEGVRIQLAEHVTAFCPVNELPTEGSAQDEVEHGREYGRDQRRGPPRNVPPAPVIWPKQDAEVSAVVLGVNFNTFEPSVSIRRFEEAQDRKRVQRYLKGAPPLTLGQLLTPESDA